MTCIYLQQGSSSDKSPQSSLPLQIEMPGIQRPSLHWNWNRSSRHAAQPHWQEAQLLQRNSASATHYLVAQLLYERKWNLCNRNLRPLIWQTYYTQRLYVTYTITMCHILCHKAGVSSFSKCPCESLNFIILFLPRPLYKQYNVNYPCSSGSGSCSHPIKCPF